MPYARHSGHFLSITITNASVLAYGCCGILLCAFYMYIYVLHTVFLPLRSTGSFTRDRIPKSCPPWGWTRTKIIGSSNLCSHCSGFGFGIGRGMCEKRENKLMELFRMFTAELRTYDDDANVLEILGGEQKLVISTAARAKNRLLILIRFCFIMRKQYGHSTSF